MNGLSVLCVCVVRLCACVCDMSRVSFVWFCVFACVDVSVCACTLHNLTRDGCTGALAALGVGMHARMPEGKHVRA